MIALVVASVLTTLGIIGEVVVKVNPNIKALWPSNILIIVGVSMFVFVGLFYASRHLLKDYDSRG